MSQKIKSYVQVERERERERAALQNQYGCLKPTQKALNFEVYLFNYTNKPFVEFLGLILMLLVGKSSVCCVYRYAEQAQQQVIICE